MKQDFSGGDRHPELRNLLTAIQIIDIIGSWIVLMIRNFKIILGIILINILTLMFNQEKHFPLFSLILLLYFAWDFFRKRKQPEESLTNPNIIIQNKHYLHIAKDVTEAPGYSNSNKPESMLDDTKVDTIINSNSKI